MEVSALGSASGSMGTCKLACSAAGVNTRFPEVAPGNEDACQSAVTNGPVSVANGGPRMCPSSTRVLFPLAQVNVAHSWFMVCSLSDMVLTVVRTTGR